MRNDVQTETQLEIASTVLQYNIPCISKEQIHQITSLFPRIAIAKATVFRI